MAGLNMNPKDHDWLNSRACFLLKNYETRIGKR